MKTASKPNPAITHTQDFVRPPQYRLNQSMLIWSLVMMAAAGAGSYGLRRFFVQRNATVLLQQAEKADAASDLKRAERFYTQFLQLTKGTSGDPAAEELRANTLVKFGQVLSRSDSKTSNVPRIARLYEESLRLKPELESARRQLIPLLMQMRRYSDALQHIAQLDKDSNSAELAFRAGRCHELLEARPKAQSRYRDSIALMPAQLSSYLGLVRVWATEKSDIELMPDPAVQWSEFEVLRSLKATGKTAPVHAAIVFLLDHMVQAQPGFEAEATRASVLLELNLSTDAPPVGPVAAAEKTANVLAEADGSNDADDMKDGVLTGPERWNADVPALADRNNDGRITPEELTQRWIEGDRGARRREAEKVLSKLESASSADTATGLNHLLHALIVARLGESASASALPAKDRQVMIDDARRLATQALQNNPTDPLVQLLIADIEAQLTQTDKTADQRQKHLESAEAALRKGLELNAPLRGRQETDEWTSPLGAVNSEITELRLRYTLGQILVSLVETHSDTTIKDKELNEAREIVTMLRQSGADSKLALLLEFRITMQRPDADRAAKLEMAKVLAREVGNPNALSHEAAAMLGRTYLQFGDAGAALEIYRRQLRAEPLWVVGRVALAEVLKSLGRTQEAIDQYESVVGFPGVAEELAVILMVQQAQRPAESRNWSRARSVLELAEVTTSNTVGTLVLRSELIGLEAMTLSQQGRARKDKKLEDRAQQMRQEAETHLRKAVLEQPKVVELWGALASLVLRREELSLEERLSRVTQVLDDAKASVGPHANLAMVELSAASEKDHVAELAVAERLASELKAFPDEGKMRLVVELGQVLTRHEKKAAARNLLYSYAEQVPDDPELHRIVNQFLFADFHPDDPTWELQWSTNLERIKSLEGTSQGYALLAEAQRLITEFLRDKEKKAQNDEEARVLEEKRRSAAKKAREFLAVVRKTRPYLSAVPRTIGMIEEANQTIPTRTSLEPAAEAYREARRLGDRSKFVVTQLVGVLLRQDYLDEQKKKQDLDSSYQSPYLVEAKRLMSDAEAEQANVVTGDLARLAWRVADGLKEIDVADKIREKLVAEPDSEQDRFDDAIVRNARNENTSEILAAFENRAYKVAPKDSQSWIPLLLYHTRLENWDEAEKAIRDAEKDHLTEKTAKNAIALAQFWDRLSNSASDNQRYTTEARDHYEFLQKQFPDDDLAQLQAAGYLMRVRQFEQADKILARLDQPGRSLPPDVRKYVKHQRIALKYPSNKYQDVRNAVEQMEKGGDGSPPELRDMIQYLQKNGNPDFLQKQAVLFDRLETKLKGRLTDDERLAFASVLDRLDRWDEAQIQFRKCLESPTAPIRIRGEYCLAMLRRGADNPDLLNTVRSELDKLVQVEPKSWRTTSVKARYLAATKQTQEATAALSTLATTRLQDRDDGRFERLLQEEPVDELFQEWLLTTPAAEQTAVVTAGRKVIALFNQRKVAEAARELVASPAAPTLDRFVVRKTLELANLMATWDAQSAEAMMAQCLSADQSPDAPRELARLYAKAGRISDAMKTCERHWERVSPAGIAYIMSLLVHSEGELPISELREWRQRLLAGIKSMTPTEQGLLNLHLGNFDNETGHFDDAIAEYAKANSSSGRRFDSLNNFAFLSARLGRNLPEASEDIESAIEIVGGLPALLDTKAALLIAKGELKEAIVLLEELSRKNADGQTLFRLAECYHRQQNAELATAYLKKAFKNGLKTDELHPLDQTVLKELQAAMP